MSCLDAPSGRPIVEVLIVTAALLLHHLDCRGQYKGILHGITPHYHRRNGRRACPALTLFFFFFFFFSFFSSVFVILPYYSQPRAG